MRRRRDCLLITVLQTCPYYFYSPPQNQHSRLVERYLLARGEKLEHDCPQRPLIGQIIFDGLRL